MVSIKEEKTVREYSGLSTDEKPNNDDIKNGSEYEEIDTGKIYKYDKENRRWLFYKKK